MSTKTLADLKRHAKTLPDDHFFDAEASRSLGTTDIKGIYRQPYSATSEGYVITVNTKGDPHAFLYRFEATEGELKWFPLGRHTTLADAEAFLASMGATK